MSSYSENALEINWARILELSKRDPELESTVLSVLLLEKRSVLHAKMRHYLYCRALVSFMLEETKNIKPETYKGNSWISYLNPMSYFMK